MQVDLFFFIQNFATQNWRGGGQQCGGAKAVGVPLDGAEQCREHRACPGDGPDSLQQHPLQIS